ncbi:MAG: methyltransferase domain-containing protein [Pseudomonadota bacterium]
MFEKIDEINRKPEVFAVYTAEALWTDEHRSKQMLAFHLNGSIDVSSRNIAFIDASAAWIIDQFDLGPGKSVCDFGCGPGLYTSRLATSGAAVTGLDFSETSLLYACEQAQLSGQKINYVQGNYLEFDRKDRFDLVTMIMCDFCALSPAQRARLLGIFHRCLKEEGALLLDVYSMAAFAERETARFYERNQLNHFWSARDYFCFVNTFKYESEAVVLDKYSIFPETGEAETVYNWLQYFSPESLRDELSAAGFLIDHMYGDVSGAAYAEQSSEFAIAATKAR